MPRFIPLNPERHLTHGWKRFDTLSFAEQDSCAPVLLAELKMLLPHYMLAFVRTAESRFMFVAVQGLFPKENLALNPTGKWVLPYVPSAYRGYPFALQQIERDGEARGLLCFDEESGLYCEAPDPNVGEERFFDEEGKPSGATQGVLDFLVQRRKNQLQTQVAVDQLAELGLLRPLAWPFESPDPEREMVKGFHGVDETAMRALPDDKLLQLTRSGALLMAHAQLLSFPRLEVMQQLHALRARHQAGPGPADIGSIETLFGDKDDTLKFNF